MAPETAKEPEHGVKGLFSRISAFTGWLSHSILFLFLLLAVYVVWKDLRREEIVIDLIEVPKDLSDKLSSETFTRGLVHSAQDRAQNLQNSSAFDYLEADRSLSRQVSWINEQATACDPKSSVGQTVGKCLNKASLSKAPAATLNMPPENPLPQWDEPDIEIPGIKLSLKSLERVVRRAFDAPETHISGYIRSENGGLTLNLRSSNARAYQRLDPIMGKDVFELQRKGGGRLLALVSPCTLASWSFVSHREDEFSDVKNLIDACLNEPAEVGYYGNILQGLIAYKNKHPAQAIKEYRLALAKVGDKSADAYFNWGLALLAMPKPNFEEVRKKFEKALDINENYSNALIGLAWLRRQEPDEAEKVLSRFKEITDGLDHRKKSEAYMLWGTSLLDTYLYNKNDAIREKAFLKFKQIKDFDPEKAKIASANGYVIWGNHLLDAGRLEEAIDKYRLATESGQDYAVAYNNWGVALYLKGDTINADTKFSEAIEKDQTYGKAHYNRAMALIVRNELARAKEELGKAIEYEPKLADAYFALGNLLQKLTMPSDAVAAYKVANDLEFPLSPDFYNDWANALLDSARTNKSGTFTDEDKQKISRAIEKYRDAIAMDPDFVYAYYNYGLALDTLGRIEDAISLYGKARDINRAKGFQYFKQAFLDQTVSKAEEKRQKSGSGRPATALDVLVKATAFHGGGANVASNDAGEDDSEFDTGGLAALLRQNVWVAIGLLCAVIGIGGLLFILGKKRQPKTPETPVDLEPVPAPMEGVAGSSGGTYSSAAAVAPEVRRRFTEVGGVYPLRPSLDQTLVLHAVSGAIRGRSFPVGKPTIKIGADPKSDLYIPGDEYVSRRHAQLSLESGTLLVADQGSRNGTLVNGQRISGSQRVLNAGDRIQIGQTVFEIRAA